MTSERSATPPAPKEKHGEKFPGRACFFAIAAAAGLFYYAVFIVPAEVPAEADLGTKAAFAFAHLVQSLPAILGGALLAAIAPALVLASGARCYLVRVALIFALLWAGLFAATTQPAASAAAQIRGVLSIGRAFPETFHGR